MIDIFNISEIIQGGDTIGRIIILELTERDSSAFEDILSFLSRHPDLEKLELRDEPIISFPGLEINLARRRIISDGREISLTAKEYDIFCLLAANKNRVLTYEQIYEKVWGDFSSGGEREIIGFHIRNLRKKLFDTDQETACQIESIRDVGYRFQYIVNAFSICALTFRSCCIFNWIWMQNAKE